MPRLVIRAEPPGRSLVCYDPDGKEVDEMEALRECVAYWEAHPGSVLVLPPGWACEWVDDPVLVEVVKGGAP